LALGNSFLVCRCRAKGKVGPVHSAPGQVVPGSVPASGDLVEINEALK
jgi:hypothetical protein